MIKSTMSSCCNCLICYCKILPNTEDSRNPQCSNEVSLTFTKYLRMMGLGGEDVLETAHDLLLFCPSCQDIATRIQELDREVETLVSCIRSLILTSCAKIISSNSVEDQSSQNVDSAEDRNSLLVQSVRRSISSCA